MRPTSPWLRALVVVATLAAVLVPGWSSPAHTISIPRTLARAVRARGDASVPLAFPATHVAFSWRGDEGTGVFYRVFDRSGGPTRWALAPESHDGEVPGRHYSAVIALDRGVRVDWRPYRPRGASMGAVTLDYLNTLDGPEVEVEVPAVAHASGHDVHVVTRRRWGADESIKDTSGGGCTRRFFRISQLFVHHTAGTNGDVHPAATMRAIYWYHTVRRGWCDVGYNFVIAPDGRVFEGRWARSYRPWEDHFSARGQRGVVGAHVENYNHGSVGISLMGDYSYARIPGPMRDSLVKLLAREADRFGLPPRGRHTYRNPVLGTRRRLPYIAGHRDAGYTSCPGGTVYASLPSIRKDVAALIGPGKRRTRVGLRPSLGVIEHGDAALFGGRLTDRLGRPLPGRAVRVYARTRRGVRWAKRLTRTTAADGSYSFRIAPRRNLSLRATYREGPATWADASPRRDQLVAPRVSLDARGGTVDERGATLYQPGAGTVVLGGVVVPPHARRAVRLVVRGRSEDGLWGVVANDKAPVGTEGGFRYSFRVPPGGGVFRAVARLRAHRDHAGGVSIPVEFVVPPGA